MAAITVVIPVFNEADSIEDTVSAVESSFRASAHTFEIIVVDDGSTTTRRPALGPHWRG